MPNNKNHNNEINVLYAVLNWGLGHATRSIPLIRALINSENENLKYNLTIASTGRALNLLQSEFPDLTFIDLPDYNIKYSNKGHNLIFYVAAQIPSIIYNMFIEHKETEVIVKHKNIAIIISDNRYGMFSRKKHVKNYFITHQLRFKLPSQFSFLEIIGELFNKFIFQFYQKILVMDNKGKPNISGDLSHKYIFLQSDKIKFIGLFSDTLKKSYSEIQKSTNGLWSIDTLSMNLFNFIFTGNNREELAPMDNNWKNSLNYLVIISGVEPQRSLFEKKVLSQIQKLDGKKVIVLGITEEERFISDRSKEFNETETLIFNKLPRKIISDLMNLSEFVICRSGYSTVMDLVYLNKKALLIPTPGQTEQEYLAKYYKNENLFYSINQEKLDLKRDVKIAHEFSDSAGSKNIASNYSSRIPINNTDLFFNEIGQ